MQPNINNERQIYFPSWMLAQMTEVRNLNCYEPEPNPYIFIFLQYMEAWLN